MRLSFSTSSPLFSAWSKWGRNPFASEHGRSREACRWDTWLIAGHYICRFLHYLGQVAWYQLWTWSAKWEVASLAWCTGKVLSKCRRRQVLQRADLGVEWLCKQLPRLTSAVFNLVRKLCHGHSELWSKQLESLSWLRDTIYDPPSVGDLMSQWQWICKFWGGHFSEFKPLANSSLWFK